jgi:outer membrane lipoprotein-sorting protein
LSPGPASAQAGPAPAADVQAILKEIDAVNRFSDSYTALMRVASYSPEGAPSISSYRMWSKGVRKALMVYLEPAKDAGKKIAMNGDAYWFYFPRAKQSMLIRPMNTLTGSIAVGDMIGEPILSLYDLSGSEATGDGGVRLTFTARGTASPYGKLEYEYRGGRIGTQKCYTRSGILLKTVTYVEYASLSGGAYATKIKIQNAVYPEYYSLIQISDLKKVDSIPDFYFTPEGLADAGNPTK